jgi:predicted DCC family thiol-disulfide oxidoreductase YuxK
LAKQPNPSDQDPALLLAGSEHSLIVFDGVCILCSGFARTITRLDRAGKFRFVTAQSPLGRALFESHGLRTDDFETNLVLIGGKAYTHLDGFIAVMNTLGWPWRAAKLLLVLPLPVRDWLYERIAKNRYALFGKKDSCDIPSPALKERILG